MIEEKIKIRRNEMKIGEYVQQGDVIIERIKIIPNGCKKLNHLVLAEGEVTGHKHQIIPEGNLIELFEKNGQMFVKAKCKGNIVHEEHGAISIETGYNLKIRKVQEWDSWTNEARAIKD